MGRSAMYKSLLLMNVLSFALASNILDERLLRYQVTELSILEYDSEYQEVPDDAAVLEISFKYFNHTIDVMAFKYSDSETDVEYIHGQTKHSSNPPLGGHFYQMENGTVSLFGYFPSEVGGFMGVVKVNNMTYYIEPASVYFGYETSKVIVYSDADLKDSSNVFNGVRGIQPTLTADRRFRSFLGRNRMRRSQQRHRRSRLNVSVGCGMMLVADSYFHESKEPDTAPYMYLLAKTVDDVFRRIHLGSLSVRILPQKLLIYETRSKYGFPFVTQGRNQSSQTYTIYINEEVAPGNEYCLQYLLSGRKLDARGRHGAAFVKGICQPSIINGCLFLGQRNDAFLLADVIRSFSNMLGHSFGGYSGRNPGCRGRSSNIQNCLDIEEMRGLVTANLDKCLKPIRLPKLNTCLDATTYCDDNGLEDCVCPDSEYHLGFCCLRNGSCTPVEILNDVASGNEDHPEICDSLEDRQLLKQSYGRYSSDVTTKFTFAIIAIVTLIVSSSLLYCCLDCWNKQKNQPAAPAATTSSTTTTTAATTTATATTAAPVATAATTTTTATSSGSAGQKQPGLKPEDKQDLKYLITLRSGSQLFKIPKDKTAEQNPFSNN